MVKGVRGILGFVGNTKRPVPLSDKEVAGIIMRSKSEESSKPVPEMKFAIGDRVLIFDGPFADHEGKVMEVDAERGLVKVQVSIFGRETPVDLGSWQVEKAD
ncbi:MAG: KOW motif-containing protein [Victivallaceae bacterium]|nr:KOW motif-containing protein [Victivallaceae bacterium]